MPPPTRVTAHPTHLADSASQKTAESASKSRAAEEESESALRLGPTIPHTNEVEAS